MAVGVPIRVLGEQQAPRDPLDHVSPSQLMQMHDDVRKWMYEWADIRLLYRGGLEFETAAGANVSSTFQLAVATNLLSGNFTADTQNAIARARRFLRQFEGEPDPKYSQLLQSQFYINYFAGILNYFRHWLFALEPTIRPEATTAPDGTVTVPDPPPWWSTFSKNCTGGGKTLQDFLKDQFLETLLTRRSGWMIGRPALDPMMAASLEYEQPTPGDQQMAEASYISQAMAEQLGLTNCLLTPYVAEEIVDWQTDATGALLWVVVVKRARVRIFPDPRQLTEVFTYMDRRRWRSWRVIKNSGAANQMASTNTNPATSRAPIEAAPGPMDTLQVIGDGWHNYGRVPFVMFELPHDLWIPNQIKKVCLDIYNRQNRLHFAQTLALYAQPTMTSEDPNAHNRIMGDGIMFQLKPGESLGYVAPPTGPYDFIKTSIDATVQELYRAVHQLSLAVDTKAVGSIARSGASKQEDRKSVEVILAAFGGYVREVMTQTLDLVSLIQGDRSKWLINGFDDFDIPDWGEQIETAGALGNVECWSLTAKKQVQKRLWTGAVIGDADEATKAKIRSEIEAHQPPPPPVPPGTPGAPAPPA